MAGIGISILGLMEQSISLGIGARRAKDCTAAIRFLYRFFVRMSDEDVLSQAAAKAARAQSLLGNELLTEAFTALEASYSAAWRATMIDDVSGREKLFLAINIVGKVRDHLTGVVNNGKIAAAELKQLADTAERRKKFGII